MRVHHLLWFRCCTFILIACATPVYAADDGSESGKEMETGKEPETVALSVQGISPVKGEDNPGILYILPWQPPSLPRRSRSALESNAAELQQPVDPAVFERHQEFQQLLNPPEDSMNSLR